MFMKSKLLVLIAALPAQLVFAQPKVYWSPEQMLKMKNISGVVPSPDGSKVLYTVREAVMGDDKSEFVNQVFLCNSDGSNTIQLTKNEKNSSNPSWSPDGKWITFTSARDGKNNLYLMSVIGGEAEKISDVKSGVGGYKWSADGKMIAFTQADGAGDVEEKNKKGKNDWYFMGEEIKQNRLFVLWMNDKDSSGKRKWKQLSKENRNIINFDWSPDGKWIAYAHGRSPMVNDNVYADIAMIEVGSGTIKNVISTNAGETTPFFSPDGKWIAYIVSEDPVVWAGKNWVSIISVDGGKPVKLAETPNTSVNILGWSRDGKNIYINESNKTLASVYKLGVDGKEITEWNKGASDLIGGMTLNNSATHFGFILQNSNKPPEGFVSATSDYTPKKVTGINDEISKNPMPKTEVVKWKSFDGKEIEGLLTYPLNYEPGKKYPLILNVHGGPAGVFTQNFIAGNSGAYPIAAFAEAGMFVLRPNPRGSTGYGVEFRLANQRDWGGGDYKDLMLGVDHVIKMGSVDAERLGVMGWSYGGFMSSWIVGHTDRFKVASIGAPVVDLSHQNLTDDIAGFLPSYMKADPWNDWAVYDKWSPIRYVQNVKTPVMLQHGEADVRVPFSNAVMFYNALKRRNVPVRLLALPRQPHGPVEPKMILKTMQTNMEWMEKYIGDKKGF
jgi:dipeptidyl aminopeptidase/acylaminoacyl peptidase